MLSVDVEVDRREFTVRAELSVPPGGRLALFGPSGAGKTTVLEVIAGLVAPGRGRIELHGRLLTSTTSPVRAVPPWRRRVGLLRQDPALFPHLSVRDNLGYALAGNRAGTRQSGRSGSSRSGSSGSSGSSGPAGLTELAGMLGIDPLLAAMPARLSGGQAHRVALGRLLLADCQALLLDEPYSGLDAALCRDLTDLVVGLVTSRQVPAILVAHELCDAQAFGDRLAILDGGQLLQTGAPDEVVRRPVSRRVAELVGYLGFVPVRWPGAGQGVVGVHPDRVVVGAHPDRGVVLAGRLTARRPAGANWEADLLVRDAAVSCRLSDRPDHGQLTVTVLDPPCFGPDGAAMTPDGSRWPEQARA